MRYLVDASVAVEYLLRTPLGVCVEPLLNDSDIYAPEVLVPEVVGVIRRGYLRQRLSTERANMALDDLGVWPITYVRHRRLVALAWRHRDDISAYDAFYVAAAQVAGATLLTADSKLAHAPSLGVPVQACRL